jgi:hypothetical protein
MCEPGAIAFGIFATAGLTAIQTFQQNKYAKRQYQYQMQAAEIQRQRNKVMAEAAARSAEANNAAIAAQQKMFENNAKSAEREGEYAKEVAGMKADEHRKQVQQLAGKQEAEMAASGAIVNSGTFLDVSLDTYEMGKIDEMALLHEGDMEAWRMENQARNYRTQSAIAGTGWQSPEYAYWAADTPVLNPMAPATSSPLIPLVSGLANAGMGYYSMTPR